MKLFTNTMITVNCFINNGSPIEICESSGWWTIGEPLAYTWLIIPLVNHEESHEIPWTLNKSPTILHARETNRDRESNRDKKKRQRRERKGGNREWQAKDWHGDGRRDDAMA